MIIMFHLGLETSWDNVTQPVLGLERVIYNKYINRIFWKKLCFLLPNAQKVLLLLPISILLAKYRFHDCIIAPMNLHYHFQGSVLSLLRTYIMAFKTCIIASVNYIPLYTPIYCVFRDL